MSHQSAIFDLDGTLLDTLEDIADSVNRVLNTAGFPVHTVDSYRYFVGDGSRMLIKRALPENDRSDDSVQRFLDAFKKDYQNAWDVKTTHYEGIPELLDGLVQRGVRMAVCTNKPHDFAVLCVEKILGRWPFEQIIGHSSTHPRKPAPHSALAIAENLQIDPDKVAFIGDSGVDMQTAVSAGMLPIGALWGFRTESELMTNGCRFLARHPLDVLQVI